MIRKTLTLLSIGIILACAPACRGKKCCPDECAGYQNERMEEDDKDLK